MPEKNHLVKNNLTDEEVYETLVQYLAEGKNRLEIRRLLKLDSATIAKIIDSPEYRNFLRNYLISLDENRELRKRLALDKLELQTNKIIDLITEFINNDNMKISMMGIKFYIQLSSMWTNQINDTRLNDIERTILQLKEKDELLTINLDTSGE